MKVSYDFHIHTDASPCGDETMTPHNIIHMARLLEKQVIAITDHNTCANCEVVMEVGKEQGILVIPGMEVECMEEFHLIALFPGMEEAYAFEKYVQAAMLQIPNKPHIFGHQYILGKNDEVVGEIEKLLLTAVQHSVYTLYEEVERLGGVLYPAHIDRNAYSILTNLGALPEDLPFGNIEISNQAPEGYEVGYEKYRILRGSDAHYLESMCEMEAYMELETLCKSEVFKQLKK
ncbi:MAG: PHP domain-containing protein [Cellulosilyticaceae bacterium]